GVDFAPFLLGGPMSSAPRSRGVCRSASVLAAALAVLAAGACTVQAEERPGAPQLDPLPERTARTSILVTGAAEPGALVRVHRVPEIPADVAPAPVRASEAGGRFR